MNDIHPNRWYTLYSAFGDSLFCLDNYWMKKDTEQLLKEWWRPDGYPLGPEISTRFKGSTFLMFLGWEDISLERLSQDSEGRPIYYPVDRPQLGDIEGVYKGVYGGKHFRTRQYAELSFIVNPALKEDCIGKPFHIKDITGIGVKAINYRYRMLIRSENGVYISKGHAALDPEGIGDYDAEPVAHFGMWRPANSSAIGNIYIPLEFKKVAGLEIMLQEKGESDEIPITL